MTPPTSPRHGAGRHARVTDPLEGPPAANEPSEDSAVPKGPDADTDAETEDDGETFVDYTDLLVAAKTRPKSLRRLPALVAESMRFAWNADRRIFLGTTTLQLLGGGITYLQLRFTKRVLDEMTAVGAHHASVASAMPSVIALVVVTSFSTVSAAVLTQQQRLLSELVSRSTWQRILDVAASVNL
ncbi:MAG: ATP-binding cassette, subfamily bacterial, partial [Actinomycetota bacterium]|nr:ATP-binding cassette, subfamily bacterial [Actinomycetota bacterium]